MFKIPAAAICILFLHSGVFARDWMGIKPKSKTAPRSVDTIKESSPSDERPAPKPKIDTVIIGRKIQSLPLNTTGAFLGTLEGVRCFNCSPEEVILNIGDSTSSEASILTMRIEVWNQIERPLKDRRVFDYDNRCVYFGHKDVDTVLVGGEWTEVRAQELECYPYLKRVLNQGGTVRSRPLTFPELSREGSDSVSAPRASLPPGD